MTASHRLFRRFHRIGATLRIATLFALLSLLPLQPAAANELPNDAPLSCQPPAGGATCDPGNGPAVLGSVGNGGIDLGIGNPINLVAGNKYQRETDMAALPGVLGLEIVRHYNSAYSREHSRSGILGRGWKLSYETSLHITARNIQVLQADGSRIIFERDSADADRCVTTDPAHGNLQIEHGIAGTHYRWQWPGGERLDFDQGGRLTGIQAASGEFLSLRYRADGALVQVTDPQGRSLHLSYPAAGSAGAFRGVRHIDSPLGRFSYLHGAHGNEAGDKPPPGEPAGAAAMVGRAALLRAVQGPPAPATAERIERRYHYEDLRHPTLLTGISVAGRGSDGVAMDLRINSWSYDERGRAVRSVRGALEDRAGEVRLHYLQPATRTSDGLTEIRNARGELTRYRHRIIGGEHRLVEALGPGCASCPPGNRRYRYDEAGRLREIAILATSADGAAAAPTLSAIRYRRDAQGRVIAIEELVPSKAGAQPVREIQRLAYEDSRWPQRPSRITRPSVVAGAEHAIELRFNAAGQLTEVLERGFSPLPVEAAQPEAGGAPGPHHIERRLGFEYASINGRSVLVGIDGPLPNGPLASPDDSDITRLHWDGRGDFIRAVTRPGGRRSEFIRDAGTGITAAVRDEDGHRADFEFDQHGQLATVRARAAPGPAIVHTRLRDALGRETELGSGSPADGDFRALLRLLYDGANRLQWSADARGFLTEYLRDDDGRLIASLRRSASMTQRHQVSTAHPGAAGADRESQFWPQQQIDDFGRIVSTRSPDSGETRRGFDAADRLVWMQDALGNRARYEYTVDGRISRQRVTAAGDGSETLTRWHYSGPHLLGVEHPGQDQAFEYDARGLRVARVVTLRTADGERRLRTRYEHDEHGRLLATTLADGSRVRFVRNGQNQVVAIERNPVRHRWLRRLARPQQIVSELERDLVGLRRYRTGNGIEALFQRSTQGQLARIAYRKLEADSSPPLLRAAIGDARAQTAEVATQSGAPGAFGLPADPAALIDHRYLWDQQGKLRLQRSTSVLSVLDSHAYDGSARLIASLRAPEAEIDPPTSDAGSGRAESWRYAYDRHGRRVLSQQGSAPDELHAGTEQHRFQPGNHRLASLPYDANGQPRADGERHYRWDPYGRLAEVHAAGRMLARYRYDHRGLRDARETAGGREYFLHDADRRLSAHLNASGHITRQYLYLGQTPLLLIDTPHGRAPAEPGSLAALIDDFVTVIASWMGSSRERLYWVHSNHLGAPEAVTDERARVVWRARYTPFGEVRPQDRIESGLRLDLRLPGQLFDAETGLHYNRARYYDPQAGQYLSPDPLGTPDGPNAYAYAAFNPLQFIDPDGLALFAFDGTGHDDQNVEQLTNVSLFRDAYDSGRVHYVSGVGTLHRDERYGDIRNPWYNGGHPGDSALNYTGPQRIDRMVLYLMDEADNTESHETMTVDIIGYSRGAAQARDFANRVAAATRDGIYYYSRPDAGGERTYYCQPVNLRFIGLFDTVLSVNHSGLSYQLDIPDAFSHVAHAIALNEFRGDAFFTRPFGSIGAFPLESIQQRPSSPIPQAGRSRIEMGFIGAHGDIGGGYAGAEGALSEIALNWMMRQARLAGVSMDDRTINLTRAPVIHDRSNAIRRGAPDDSSEDRSVRYRDGTSTTQRAMILATGMSFPDTLSYIRFSERSSVDGATGITGTVDAAAYLRWLKHNGHELTLEVQ